MSTVVAAMLMGAFSAFLAITLSRLFHHHTNTDSGSDAATSQGPAELRPDA
jgi:hypothetical protein